MVNFELQFSSDVKSLSISVAIDSAYTSNYYIQSVYLEYYKNRNVTNVPNYGKALLLYENKPLNPGTGPDDPNAFQPIGNPDTNVKSWNNGGAPIPESMLDFDRMGVAKFKDGLFYVYVICQNVDYEHHADDITIDVNGVLDWTAVYDRGMALVDRALVECKKGCAVTDEFEQSVLTWHALDFALAANDADELDRLWSRFVTLSPLGTPSVSSCNCI